MIPNLEAARLHAQHSGHTEYFVNVWHLCQSPAPIIFIGDAHAYRHGALAAAIRPHPSGYRVAYRIRIKLSEVMR